MSRYAMLVNYGYCTGCHSCEIACKNEKGLSREEWGIRVHESGPEILQGEWEWDYLAVPSRLCDLCAERVEAGNKASCELHCLAHVIEILPLEDASKRMGEFGEGKVAVYLP